MPIPQSKLFLIKLMVTSALFDSRLKARSVAPTLHVSRELLSSSCLTHRRRRTASCSCCCLGLRGSLGYCSKVVSGLPPPSGHCTAACFTTGVSHFEPMFCWSDAAGRSLRSILRTIFQHISSGIAGGVSWLYAACSRPSSCLLTRTRLSNESRSDTRAVGSVEKSRCSLLLKEISCSAHTILDSQMISWSLEALMTFLEVLRGSFVSATFYDRLPSLCSIDDRRI